MNDHIPPRRAWNKGKRLPAEPLTDAEARRLINACSRRAPTGLRNQALLVVLYRAGLRLDEALSLRPKDVDLTTGEVHVLHGKGDKSRVVGLPPGPLAVVHVWLSMRTTLGLNGHQTIFCTLTGEKLQAAYVRALLPRLAKRAGIEKRVHAHGLRHTFAVELLKEGMPMDEIQGALGHSSIATTVRYVDHLHPKAVVDALRARDWEL